MLTARQKLLLKLIIEEFINTAEAVGSLTLSDKYKLEFSPATIRNEMSRLAQLGLLDKNHTSSGRVPTSRAIKLFLTEMLNEYDHLDAITAARVREELFQRRFSVDKLITEAINELHKLTNNTAVALLGNRIYSAGISQFLDEPEYKDIVRLKKILNLMEDYAALTDLFSRSPYDSDVQILVGEETGIDQFSNSAVAFARINIYQGEDGCIAVIGPNRMRYSRVIPVLRYIVRNVQDVVEGW